MNTRTLLFSALAFVLAAALMFVPGAHAQQAGTDQHENLPGNLPDFAPVEFALPNQYRAASGRPGPQYWQNEADYAIDVALDPEAERLDGTVTISYTNNAPQALDYLWVQLDQNLFQEGSRGSALTSEEDRFSGAFGEGGYEITNVRVQRSPTAPRPAAASRWRPSSMKTRTRPSSPALPSVCAWTREATCPTWTPATTCGLPA